VIADDISLEHSSLPKNFERDHPKLKRDKETGKYTAYDAFLCRVLARSPQCGDALRNADSITGIVLALSHIWETRDGRELEPKQVKEGTVESAASHTKGP
jgi:hypothetical protein